jgi:UDP-glucose 4-epimerase
MKIVVTGAAGFLGSHLSDALVQAGHTVVGLDNLSMGSLDNLAQLAEQPTFEFIHADVQDQDRMASACARADAIVHLAGYKIPRYGGAVETLQINLDGTRSVLEVAAASQALVVFASTSDVYGKSSALPFTEDGDLVLGPSTVSRWSYAASKIADEHLILAYGIERRLPVVVLRLFGSYGPRQHLSWWGGPQSVFISAVLGGSPIEIHGDGHQTRSFTYVSDTVQGFVRALETPAALGEVINVGNDHEISIVELAHVIHRLAGAEGTPNLRFVPYKELPGGRYEDVLRRVPSTTKAARILGLQCEVDLETGLLRTLEWQREELGRRLRAGG